MLLDCTGKVGLVSGVSLIPMETNLMRKKLIDLPKSFGELSERELRLIGPPKKFDNTLRTTFKQCARKFYWWKIRKVDYLIRPSYFSWGSAWHETKGSWITSPGIKAEPLSPEWKESATMAILVGLNFWDNSGATETELETRANLIRLWKDSIRAYPQEEYSVIKGGAEVGWLWPLPLRGGQSSSYFLAGSMDGVIHWEGFGYLPLEIKTTGMWISDWYLLQWNFSSQITGYIWYVQQLLGTETVYGAYLDISTKQNVAAAKASTTPQFSRPMQTRTEDELREFENDWRMDIELIERAYDKWHFPKTTDTVNCTGGIGKSRCLYAGFCLSGIRKGLIDPMSFPNTCYRKEEWTPWERSPAQRKRQQLTAFPFRNQPVEIKNTGKTDINKELVAKLAWRNERLFHGQI